ncbi:MAG TPA: hypothetical protein VFR86_14800 [Burkholderiaceae bacterium]|nr:hypothetical protein [Burkholderiaceae bacterium]
MWLRPLLLGSLAVVALAGCVVVPAHPYGYSHVRPRPPVVVTPGYPGYYYHRHHRHWRRY